MEKSVKSTGTILEEFRDAAIQAGDLSDSKAQNKAARKLQACYKMLCMTEEGKAGLIGLMFDSNPGVRLSAAARCLQWVPKQAESTLVALQGTNVFPISFEAEMTLEQHRKGKLSFDY